MPVKSWKRDQVIGTREHLIETALQMFGERGYAATPLEEVVARAGLSRGALYHHFKDKRALFEAVVDRRLWDLVNEVDRRTVKRAARRGVERESDTIEHFIEELGDATTHRVLLVDGPAALGRERWSDLMEARLLDPIRRVVELAAERGALEPALVPGLTHLLFGSVQEAALLIGQQDAKLSRVELDRAVSFVLERLLGPAELSRGA